MQRKLAIGVGAAVAVLAAGGGVAILNRTSAPSSAEPATTQAVAVAVPATDREVEPVTLPKPAGTTAPPKAETALRSLDIAPKTTTATKLDVPQRSTETFSMLGIAWTDPAAVPAGAMQVKTRSAATGRWSDWRTLEVSERGPDRGSEGQRPGSGATSPLWVGPSNGVAARIVPAAGKVEPLPAGLRIAMIDTGREAKSTGGQGGGMAAPSGSPSAQATAAAAPAAVPALPSYVSRAQWGADESIVVPDITVGSAVRAVFVHHTADPAGDDYTCDQSDDIVRGIQRWHVNVEKWSDIGYNYLVDKCGTLFEGRVGGVDKPVIGAHTYGFNTDTTGIAVIGTYTSIEASAAAQATVAKVAAARLGAYGFDPMTTVELTQRGTEGKWPEGTVHSFERISGHRDGYATECPGDKLYAQLPSLRIRTAANFAATPLTGATMIDGAPYVQKSVTANWSYTDNPAAGLTGFDLLVDGTKVGSAPPAARSAAVAVPAGKHTVSVRAVHSSGVTLPGAGYPVTGDPTAPTFTTSPFTVLRTGTYSATAAPVTVWFRATDNVKVSWIQVTQPQTAALAGTATSWSPTVKPGVATAYSLTARDHVGNARPFPYTRTVVLAPETSATRTGTWSGGGGTSNLNSNVLSTKVKNSKLTWTFTGNSAALLFQRTSVSGLADIYVDNVKVATVDLKSSATLYRQAVWTRNLAYGKHTVAVVAQGTAGRPWVISDGLAYVK
ncbi:N-acetylmuramoyl-L-alanine amidase [Actinoplanes utahensis]|uniref:Peptidoglycan recognition protein family domain-containing protein n=1 Tax=Actinoplanes utahensis TaxID=1869 RepID=A0A0A6UAU7_ACTUT|nr:N-acetylmuramoyl-L-alanine amidase [Actinoplanes utahensis]KHD72183.1 hypothetical protein MB27_41840 [Actinoplanes utahensis]